MIITAAPEPAKAISRFSLANLAIKSAIDLERLRAGGALSTAALSALADALTQTSNPRPAAGPSRFFAVGYHKPFMRLYKDHEAGARSVGEVQERLTNMATVIRDFLDDPSAAMVDELASFCADLHHELATDHLAENRLVRRRRSRSGEGQAAASLC